MAAEIHDTERETLLSQNHVHLRSNLLLIQHFIVAGTNYTSRFYTLRNKAISRLTFYSYHLFPGTLSRNHWYVFLIPSSRGMLARQPIALIFEVSTNFRGVPSGLLES